MARCFDPRLKNYHRYGGRGITVSPEFCDVEAYVLYVVSLPRYGTEATHIDRINNDGNYERGNLQWATPMENARNREVGVNHVIYRGERMLFKDFIAAYCCISLSYAYGRFREGATLADLIDMPPGDKAGKAARIRFDELRSKRMLSAG
jgi:hypothetical protein